MGQLVVPALASKTASNQEAISEKNVKTLVKASKMSSTG
jgi:hypothetical protein